MMRCELLVLVSRAVSGAPIRVVNYAELLRWGRAKYLIKQKQHRCPHSARQHFWWPRHKHILYSNIFIALLNFLVPLWANCRHLKASSPLNECTSLPKSFLLFLKVLVHLLIITMGWALNKLLTEERVYMYIWRILHFCMQCNWEEELSWSPSSVG